MSFSLYSCNHVQHGPWHLVALTLCMFIISVFNTIFKKDLLIFLTKADFAEKERLKELSYTVSLPKGLRSPELSQLEAKSLLWLSPIGAGHLPLLYRAISREQDGKKSR